MRVKRCTWNLECGSALFERKFKSIFEKNNPKTKMKRGKKRKARHVEIIDIIGEDIERNIIHTKSAKKKAPKRNTLEIDLSDDSKPHKIQKSRSQEIAEVERERCV